MPNTTINAPRDGNFIPAAVFAVSGNTTAVQPGQIDSTTGRVLVDQAGGSGTVTSVSVVTANGLAGSVASSTTTPAITLSTTITGILKGNGTAISAASSGTDYVAPGAATSSGLTMSSARLLGRTTASSGAIEEISVGTGLSLSAGSLTATGGSGTVTTVSVATANGFSGSVANPTTTPAITIIAGAITPNSVVASDATTPYFETASGSTNTGYINIKGKTSGSLKITASDAAAQVVTLSLAAQTSGVATLTIPDMAHVNKTVAWLESPSFTTPALGTPSAGVLTSCTGLPAASVVAGTLGTGAYVMDTKLTVPQVLTTSNAITASGNAATVPITYKINTVTNNSAATLTITMATASAIDGQLSLVRILDASGVAQTISWVNTENSTVSAPTTSNGSTTLPLTVGFQFNNATTKWRCIASA